MYERPGAWHALLALLARTTARYLNGQIAAGAQAVQLFDSWVGALGPDDYRAVRPARTRARSCRPSTPGVPVIHFGTGTAGLLEAPARGGRRRHRPRLARRAGRGLARGVGHDVAVQGNLDPAALFAPPGRDPPAGRRDPRRRPAAGRATSSTSATACCPEPRSTTSGALVDAVHELSERRSGPPGMDTAPGRRRRRRDRRARGGAPAERAGPGRGAGARPRPPGGGRPARRHDPDGAHRRLPPRGRRGLVHLGEAVGAGPRGADRARAPAPADGRSVPADLRRARGPPPPAAGGVPPPGPDPRVAGAGARASSPGAGSSGWAST